jgi:hypothetical protein
MYTGVLGEKPEKTYYGLYQHRKHASPGRAATRGSAAARQRHQDSHNDAADDGYSDVGDSADGASEHDYGGPSSAALGHYAPRSAAPSVAESAAWGTHARRSPSVQSSVYAARRSVPELGTLHSQPSVPLLGDPRQSPRASTVGGKTFVAPAHLQPYGAAPKDLVALQQYGLDGRSVFPDGYVRSGFYFPRIPARFSAVRARACAPP